MSDPAGLRCPACESPPLAVLGGGSQAFCSNTECAVLTWNPTMTLAELADDMRMVELPAEWSDDR